jgi:hypothetical protein
MSLSVLKAIGPGPAEPHPQFDAVAEMPSSEFSSAAVRMIPLLS